MKILIRNAVFSILAATILLLTVTCVEPSEPAVKIIDTSSTYGSVHFDTLHVTGEQVWMPNYNTGKISQMLLKFTGDRPVVDVVVIEYAVPPIFYTVGTGKIEKGILSFNVDKIDNDYLLDNDDLFYFYFKDWYKNGDNIVIDHPEVKGNIITLVTLYNDDSGTEQPIEGIIREGFSGTSNSLTGEYIYYLYVDGDCKISADKVEKTNFQYTFNEFELSLKAGWNTICKSETYTTSGDSSYSMTVKNPSIRWVMQKTR